MEGTKPAAQAIAQFGGDIVCDADIEYLFYICEKGSDARGFSPLDNYLSRIEAVLKDTQELDFIVKNSDPTACLYSSIKMPAQSTIDINPDAFKTKLN